MTEVNFQGNYYDLRGTPAQIEQILNQPYRIAVKWIREIRNPKENVILKIIEFVGGILLLLAAYPLKMIGDVVNYSYRTEIDAEEYKKEYTSWSKLFVDKEDVNQDLIQKLIASQVKAEECAFDHLLCLPMSENSSKNFFSPDGRYSRFIHHFQGDEAKKCLIIGFVSQFEQEWCQQYFRGKIQLHEAQQAYSITKDEKLDEDSFNFKVSVMTNNLDIEHADHEIKNRVKGMDKAKWVWMNSLSYHLPVKNQEELIEIFT